ncbi:GIY-YIG nuclease family protein [Spirulina sp. CCNP1310]|uniref:GIY-YIG nuclease family protein n=1 Tax=Spirulina sp. CCNP1310 TaxID=3110249 RepID=UPI002B20087F|nr:GIY-YIG nuclease family protein [Spirulina sp. CCNP1310]MEA5421221.1 GIY-YIG nuclease family protein [Spirulina sp. CCNP1310]
MAKSLQSTTDEDLALLGELGIDLAPEPLADYSPREERIIAGFEEIERFVLAQGRLPQQGEDRDIFERLYAVRLDRLRESEECRTLLEPFDPHHLLTATPDISPSPAIDVEAQDDQALLAALGLDTTANEITQLTHVRSRQEIKAAEEVAQRNPCLDFEQFQPLFKQVQQDLKSGARATLKYQDNAQINRGDLFILKGQKILVAAAGEVFTTDSGLLNHRLRVVYDNGTESDLLMRSLQRALNKDKTSRRITTPDLGPLFSQTALAPQGEGELDNLTSSPDDLPSGYIYVLRSQSDVPFIAENRSVIHKIGVTGGNVKKRIANAKHDPTYLLADVEIVATFKLSHINPKKLETLIHRFLSATRLDVELQDRFAIPVNPREWFLVPLEAIEVVIEKIKDGTLDQFRYDRATASLTRL